jgi:hypothetical protein
MAHTAGAGTAAPAHSAQTLCVVAHQQTPTRMPTHFVAAAAAEEEEAPEASAVHVHSATAAPAPAQDDQAPNPVAGTRSNGSTACCSSPVAGPSVAPHYYYLISRTGPEVWRSARLAQSFCGSSPVGLGRNSFIIHVAVSGKGASGCLVHIADRSFKGAFSGS